MKIFTLAIALAAVLPFVGVATAQDTGYPDKPVHLIVPFGPGGGTDLTTRMLQAPLSETLGVPVVVENRPGGGSWVGWGEMLRAKPDGYTLAVVTLPNLIVGYANPAMERTETWQDFDFIAGQVTDAGVIAVRASDDRFATIDDLVAYAKENSVAASSSGVGSATHFAGLKMNALLGTDMKFVHSSGTGVAIPATIGGSLDVLISGIGEVLPSFESGDLRPLAVFGSERVSQLPDVPTLTEATGVEFSGLLWRAIAAPQGLPNDVRAKLEAALLAAVASDAHVEAINRVGLGVETASGDDLVEMVKSEEESIMSFGPDLGWR